MDSAHLDIGVAIGDTLLGKYRVERVLGAGGMGAVVAARHLRLDHMVAIKVLLPEVIDDAEIVARFEREGRASASITSDHIARVTDVGVLDSGAPFMVMEYLAGEDLEAILKREGTLSVEQAVELAIQACDVLSEAHALGIVHRDLKPANLYCVARGERFSIKVLDFGISKVMNEHMTNVHGLMGSPAYMSPEQIRAPHGVDGRADIWALGVVLYEALTGQVPFDGRTIPAMLTSIAIRPTPSIRRMRPDVPAGLEAVIQKCLEKNCNDRFATAADLARAIAPFAERRPPRSQRQRSEPPRFEAVRDIAPASGPGVAVLSWWGTRRGTRREGMTGWAGVGAAAAIVFAAISAPWSRGTAGASAHHATAFAMSAPSHAAGSQEKRPYLLPSDLPVDVDASIDDTKRTCTLDLESEAIATVTVDGRSLGTTPTLATELAPGAHRVTFETGDHARFSTSASCDAGETTIVVAGSTRAPAPKSSR
jgi:serine/threonine-protein kinase